jgi:hypothetical protein
MQLLILDALQESPEPLSTADLRGCCELDREIELHSDSGDYDIRLNAAQRRPVRISMDRALRGLVAAGKIKRNADGLWEPKGKWGARRAYEEERTKTAFHEAGHAVIGLAVGFDVGAAIIDKDHRGKVTEPGSGDGGVVASGRYAGSIGYYMRGRKVIDSDLDAFGNKRERPEPTPEEHHGEVIMCIAGGMAEAKLLTRADWRSLASSGDMNIARRHRKKLGDAAKAWAEYERATAGLVERYWPMIQAVANALLQKRGLSGYDIDNICRRVRRHELKIETKRSRATTFK